MWIPVRKWYEWTLVIHEDWVEFLESWIKQQQNECAFAYTHNYITLRCITLHHASHSITLLSFTTTLHGMALHYIAWQCITLHYITSHTYIYVYYIRTTNWFLMCLKLHISPEHVGMQQHDLKMSGMVIRIQSCALNANRNHKIRWSFWVIWINKCGIILTCRWNVLLSSGCPWVFPICLLNTWYLQLNILSAKVCSGLSCGGARLCAVMFVNYVWV